MAGTHHEELSVAGRVFLCVVAPGQCALCGTPVLLQGSRGLTLHLPQGGEYSLGAGVGLPLPHPRNAVLCPRVPSQPRPAERQHCPRCLLTWRRGFGTSQLSSIAAPGMWPGEEGCGQGRKAVLRRKLWTVRSSEWHHGQLCFGGIVGWTVTGQHHASQ